VSAFFAFVGGVFVTLIVRSLFRKHAARMTITKDGHSSFPVDTLAQMLAIPAERRERFLAELPATLRRMWELMDRHPLAAMPGAMWVDDGLGEFRPNAVNVPDNYASDDFAARPIADAPESPSHD
jgi:hypothetical protein